MITETGLLSVVRDRSHPDLTARTWMVMFLLRDGDPVLTRNLAATVNCDKSVLTRIGDTLLHLGYIRRQRGTIDRRDMYMTLTAAGKRYLAALAGEKGRRAA